MFDVEEITNKWCDLGFLEQMPENLKSIVALKYELVANHMLSNDSYMDDTTLSNSIFPIIYRIYKQGKTIPNVETFIRQTHGFFLNNREIMRDFPVFPGVDMEAEMCALFVEQWKSRKEIEPIKWVSKHKFSKKEKPIIEEELDPVSEPTDDTIINWWDRLKHFFRNLIKK